MNDEICGYCGTGNPDKVAASHGWPNQVRPGTPYVHAECEDAAAREAMSELSGDERDLFLRSLR